MLKNDRESAVTRIPLVALARGVEELAATMFVRAWGCRLASCAMAIMALVATANRLLSDTMAVAFTIAIISFEATVHLKLLPRAGELQRLARSILIREMYIAAGLLSNNHPETAKLRSLAESISRSTIPNARRWLALRVIAGKRDDGTDFHSTTECNPECRLLDMLYENYCWWSEIAPCAARRIMIPMCIAMATLTGAIIIVGTFIEHESIRVIWILALLQIVVLLFAVSCIQEWSRWHDAALAFSERMSELKKVIYVDPDDINELHLYATAYAVLVMSVPPVPRLLLDFAYQDIDARVVRELEERKAFRAMRKM